MVLRIGAVFFILLMTAAASAATIVRVTGRVVDAKGSPVAGSRIAERWFAEQGQSLEPYRPVRSDADGRFSLELDLFNRDRIVMAIDAAGQRGGVATVSVKEPEKPLRIELAPLAELRVRYASEKPDQPLDEGYITLFLADGLLPVAGARSRTAGFTLRVPPGRYTLYGDESYRRIRDIRDFSLAPGKPLDLGEIKLRLSPIARLYGKPAPAWHVTAARGVPESVQPADFRGKWVVLEFWGFWCGPCVGRGLPGWVDFADDHAADRDKFVILAVHDPQATDLKMLDAKLKTIVRRQWRGRPLPFPILLDTSGQMVKEYGVQSWPTAVLLDPEGRVAAIPHTSGLLESHECEDFLASKLTPLPIADRIARALDRDLNLYVDDGQTLAEHVSFYGKQARIRIRLDPSDLKAAHVDEQARIPLSVGGRLTLRAWLNLTLDPLDLSYVADGDGLRIVPRSARTSELSKPSPRQEAENSLVAAALNQQITFDFHARPLNQAMRLLETKTDETFVLDPLVRLSGKVKPDTPVTGSAVNEPLSSALPRLLAPLGLTYTIRNEAVVIATGNAKARQR